MTQTGKFALSAISLAVIGVGVAVTSLTPMDNAQAGAGPMVAPELVQPAQVSPQQNVYQQVGYVPQQPAVVNVPLANPAVATDAPQPVVALTPDRPTAAEIVGRYHEPDDLNDQVKLVDAYAQSLFNQTVAMTNFNTFNGFAANSLQETVDTVNGTAELMNSFFNRHYLGLAVEADELRSADDELRLEIAGNTGLIGENAVSITGNSEKIVDLKKDLSSTKETISTFIDDNDLQRYALYNYAQLGKSFTYTGNPGMQPGGAYCDESEELRSLAIHSTHKAVHCLFNITNDPSEMLWVAYKGSYPKSNGAAGTVVTVAEGGAIFKSVVPRLRFHNVKHPQIQAMLRTLADPEVYKRPVRTPSEVAGTRVATVKKQSTRAPAPVATVPQGSVAERAKAKIERLAAASTISAGDEVSLASGGSNSSVAGKDGYAIRAKGTEINVNIQ